MTIPQTKLLDSLECSHCESIGEIGYESFQRQQKDLPVKAWIKNLPEGISEAGLRNLFITVGDPLNISYYPKSRSALVEFRLMKEIELAMRDLHCKAPYNLRVVLANPKNGEEIKGPEVQSKVNPVKANDTADQTSKPKLVSFKKIPPRKIPVVSLEDITSEAIVEAEREVKTIVKVLGYDPSVRMRQKKLDFKTDTKCVSLGRGYMNMGDKDRFVGGLQKFESESENSKAKDKVQTVCENCQALTTKMCASCSAPYCSKACMGSNSDHRKKCFRKYFSSSDVRKLDVSSDPEAFEFSSGCPIPEIPLRSGCTVLMPSYFTMQTVFVRPFLCEEKLKQMSNEIALEAIKGKKLKKTPEMYDLVLARYYEDLCFYRGQICAVEENKIFVFFIDYGNTQETQLEDLRVMPGHLKLLPGLAVRVQLKDVPKSSSIEAVNYYNKLTADGIRLLMKFKDSKDEVILIEKETKNVVNEMVVKLTLPSWTCDESAFSKTGEIFYLNSMKSQKLEVGKKYNLILTHFDEKEFLESEVFWVTDEDTDEYYHASSELKLRISQYCEFLQGDCYLPRTNELCLAKENGEWKRCVNLKSHNAICYLFFLDNGHSSFVETSNIRKMIPDFLETPSQSVCCTLPGNPKLKSDKNFQSRVVHYLKTTLGLTMSSVRVLKLMGDAYCLGIPAIEKIQEILNILENKKN